MFGTLTTIAAAVFTTAYLIKKNIIQPDVIVDAPKEVIKYCKEKIDKKCNTCKSTTSKNKQKQKGNK